MYRNDNVFFDEYNETTDGWKFTVMGSKRYQVLIKGVNSKNIQTSCTCPFDWGSICKHAVAALLFVSDNLGEQSVLHYQKQTNDTSQKPLRKGKNLGFEIPEYEHIDLDFVKRNVSARDLGQLLYHDNYFVYNSVKITEESLTFETPYADSNIKFYREDGKVYVTSPMAKKSMKLTWGEARCLAMIANSPMPNLLDEVFSGRVLERQKKLLKNFGLPENVDFNQYFSYSFTQERGLLYYPSDKGVGLVPVIEDEGPYVADLLRKLTDNELIPEELPQITEQRELGFVLKKASRFYSSYEGGFNDFYGIEITEYKRNFELENDFLESLAALHPDFESLKNRKIFYLHYSDFTKDMWFYKFFDQLQAGNVEVFGLKDLKNFKYSPYKGKINTSLTSGQDWFEVDIAVRFGDNRVTLNDIKKAVINKQRYIQLNDGSVGILPSEWLHKLEKYFRNGEIKNDKLEISKLRFSVVDELFDNIDHSTILQEIAEKRQRLKNFSNINETEVPKQIKATLRHYQKEGLNWLNFLDEMEWGGILADDMGLGKTLQVLAFLQQQSIKNKGVNLIVVPTTLLFNWENELKKFAPKLKAFYYYGSDREKDGIGKSKMMVLEGLTRLRQICDSPVLLNSEEITENQSVKIKEIVRHITDKTGRHKILVFSQFVKMLELIQNELAKLNIEYEYLDGQSSSNQREQSVNNFQENENLRVFLISLKAGGTGLNLTAADYVYIVDPVEPGS